jgi:hypothetical protein
METQSYSNHIRKHPFYHYFLVPVTLALIVGALVNLFLDFGLSAVMLLMAMIVLHLVLFLVRDYAKKNQDRIIRAELRLRYFQLTNSSIQVHEETFTTGQLLALRFADDKEFLRLLNNPETKGRSADEIKKGIQNWNPDLMRI